jgi:hypothetical protein
MHSGGPTRRIPYLTYPHMTCACRTHFCGLVPDCKMKQSKAFQCLCVGGIKQLHGGTFVYVLGIMNLWGSTLLLYPLRLPAHVIPCNYCTYHCTFSFGKLTNLFKLEGPPNHHLRRASPHICIYAIPFPESSLMLRACMWLAMLSSIGHCN